MPSQICEAGLQRGKISASSAPLATPPCILSARTVATSTAAAGFSPAIRHLMSKNFLGAEIGAEARLGDDVIGEFERRSRRHEGIAAMGDVGERAAMHERGRALQGLHEIGPQRVLKQRGHRARGVEVGCGDRPPVPARADHHPAQLLLEIVEARGKAESSHHLRGDRYVETVLARKAVARRQARR